MNDNGCKKRGNNNNTFGDNGRRTDNKNSFNDLLGRNENNKNELEKSTKGRIIIVFDGLNKFVPNLITKPATQNNE